MVNAGADGRLVRDQVDQHVAANRVELLGAWQKS